MVTYDTVLERVFAKLLAERIETSREMISTGHIKSYEEYKYHAGFIAGMRFALEEALPLASEKIREH